MTYLVGELAAEIRLHGKEQFSRDLSRAGQDAERAASVGSRAGARLSASFTQAAAATTAVTAAGVALGVSVFKTGAAYNTLQQTSRAALKTLLGSAEAANDQMRKLDDFARTSPFGKGIFISAQQQLLGFGMEAKKVIPVLDAVQNSVAATGGSGQTLSEITYVLAQIQAAGKITATDLMQLGQRGVNAAELIGSQMGMTGAQIRESITDGKLGAEEALDALVAGMQAKFKGASENVKTTVVGAQDRIKAATREIGAALASPFIAQGGGGYAVQWGNQVADVLQGVRSHAEPVVSILEQRLAPAFGGFTRQLDRAAVVVKSWDSSQLEQFLDDAGKYTPVIAGLGGAIFALTTGPLKQIPVLGQLVPTLGPVPAALLAIAATSPQLRAAGAEALESLSPLVPLGADLARTLSGTLAVAIPPAASLLGSLATVARPLAEIVASIPSPVLAAAAAFLAMRAAGGQLTPVLSRGLDAVRTFGQEVALQQAIANATGGALDATGRKVGLFGGTLGVATQKVRGLGGALKAAFIGNPVGLALTAIATAVGVVSFALAEQGQKAQEAKDRISEYRTSLDEATGSAGRATRELIANRVATDEWSEKLKDAGVSGNLFVDAVMGAEGAADKLRRALVASTTAGLTDKTFSDAEFIARQLGVTVDDLVASMLGYSDAGAKVEAAVKAQGAAGLSTETRLSSLQSRIESFTGSHRSLIAESARSREEIEQAEKEAREYEAALREASAAMTDAERSNGRLNDAVAIARDVTRDASERVRALKQALDELDGGARTAAQAERDLSEQALRVADAFAQEDENGKKVAKSLVTKNGAIDVSTEAGIRLFDSVDALNDAMLTSITLADEEAKARGEAGVSTEDAAKILETYSGKLREAAEAAGVPKERIDALIETMLTDVPALRLVLEDNGTISLAEQQLAGVLGMLADSPEGSVRLDAAEVEGVMDELRELGAKITVLPDGTVRVTLSGVEDVRSELDRLTQQRIVNIQARLGTTPTTSPGGPVPSNEAGGLWAGGVRTFETGGMPFPSGLYRGSYGGIHKFAEKNLPWEAYISPHPMYRERNQAILTEAAARLGGVAAFEQGGISEFAGGGMWTSWARSVRRGEAKRSAMNGGSMALIDQLLDAAALHGKKSAESYRKTAMKSERELLRLEKRAEKTAAQLERASSRLDRLKGLWQQMADSVSNAVRGFFDAAALGGGGQTTKQVTVNGQTLRMTGTSTAPVTAGGIGSSMKGTANRMKQFNEKLAKLIDMGFRPAYVAEIAELGIERGEPIIDALLKATKTERNTINREYDRINRWSKASGTTVADGAYGDKIADQQKTVDTLEKRADSIEKKIEQQVDRIIKVATEALKSAPKKALGGGIFGPGTGTSDSVLMWGANGEHMWTAEEVRAAGGHAGVERIRKAVLQGKLPAHRNGGPIIAVPQQPQQHLYPVEAVQQLQAALPRSGDVKVSIVNPITRDLEQEAWEAAQIIGGARV